MHPTLALVPLGWRGDLGAYSFRGGKQTKYLPLNLALKAFCKSRGFAALKKGASKYTPHKAFDVWLFEGAVEKTFRHVGPFCEASGEVGLAGSFTMQLSTPVRPGTPRIPAIPPSFMRTQMVEAPGYCSRDPRLGSQYSMDLTPWLSAALRPGAQRGPWRSGGWPGGKEVGARGLLNI